MNVKEIREANALSQQQLADLTGIPKDRIAKWEQGKGTPKAQDHLTLEKFFLDYVPQGTSKTNSQTLRNGAEMNDGNTGDKKYFEKRRALKGLEMPYLVPLVPVKAQAGYARSYSNVDFLNTLDMRPILPNIDPRGAVWRYFEIEGDSMIPTLFERDTILVSMVPTEDWKDLKPGQVYVIITGDDTLVKIIYPLDLETWILASSNKKIKQRKIKIADVNELWKFRGLSTRNLVIPKIQIKL